MNDMLTLAQNNDDNAPKTRTVQLPSRDQITTLQIHTLLAAVQGLSGILRLTDEDGGVRDGGTLAAVETSIINACSALDTIFEDKSRWSLDQVKGLEEKLGKVYEAHLDVLTTQKKVLLDMKAPHRAARPAIMPTGDGRWAAVLGDAINNWEGCIVGVGTCPQGALDNFDEVFNGIKQQSNETNLDNGGDKPTESFESARERIQRDLYNAQQDGGVVPPEIQ